MRFTVIKPGLTMLQTVGYSVLFSGATPVACSIEKEYFRTDEALPVRLTSDIDAWLEQRGATLCPYRPQEFFEALPIIQRGYNDEKTTKLQVSEVGQGIPGQGLAGHRHLHVAS